MRRRHHRRETRSEIGLGHAAGLLRIEFVEPGIGDRGHFSAGQLVVLIAIGISEEGARQRCACATATAAEPACGRGTAGGWPCRTARVSVIRVAGRMDSCDALPAANELEQRRTARVGRGLVVRIIEEATGRAIDEHQVVLLQVLGVDVGRVVGGHGGPGSELLPHLVDRRGGQRYRRVHEPGGMTEDQDLVRLGRFCRRLCGKRRLHLLDIGRTRNLRIAAAPAAWITLGLWRRGCGQRAGYDRGQLRRSDGTGVGRISRRVPLIKSTFQFVAADSAVFVAVGNGE